MAHEVKVEGMRRGIKTFVEALRRKNVKMAKEKFEWLVKGLDIRDEYWWGYRRALEGMVVVLESGDELSLLRQLVDKKYPGDKIKELIEEMQVKVSQNFRPRDEKGYHTAWIEVLQVFDEFGRKSESRATR